MYFSDDPGRDFDRWEADRERLHEALLEEGFLAEDEEDEEI